MLNREINDRDREVADLYISKNSIDRHEFNRLIRQFNIKDGKEFLRILNYVVTLPKGHLIFLAEQFDKLKTTGYAEKSNADEAPKITRS